MSAELFRQNLKRAIAERDELKAEIEQLRQLLQYRTNNLTRYMCLVRDAWQAATGETGEPPSALLGKAGTTEYPDGWYKIFELLREDVK